MKYARRRGFIDRESYVAQYIALALMSIGLTSMLGSDDLLAAFAAGGSAQSLPIIFNFEFFLGSAISWDGDFNVQIENDIFSAVIDLVLNCATFIYIGAWLPFETYNTPEVSAENFSIINTKVMTIFCSLVYHLGGSWYFSCAF
jgi:NhaP-type Na+/H+ or K+/H+ antiporter